MPPKKINKTLFDLQLQLPLNQIQDDAFKLFSGQNTGHLGYMRYGSPKFNGDRVLGAEFWHSSQNSSDYYLSREETSLLKSLLPDLQKMGIYAETLIDFGPGDEIALSTKTIPLLNAIGSKRYIAFDTCVEYATNAAKRVASQSTINTSYRIENFFTKDLPLSIDNGFIFMAGSTITNMPIDIRVTDCNLYLTAFLSRIRRKMKNKGYFLIGYDANNDPITLDAAYNNNLPVSRFYQNAFWMIERDSHYHFNPDDFIYQGKWIPEEYRFAHFLIAKNQAKIAAPSENYIFDKGTALHIDNSYKFPVEMMIKAAENAGWSFKKVWTQTGRVHYILLEAK